ncbi:hypothetical protein B0H16DRAFT_1711201 [Mycena metata]|uniref:Uncharacterized protein n=1 Tax=Mycena metata TaxID=1033252 RepID=A0AAD7NYA1_9AGAR|nr:hypothetical protein B0H16DRAFT_1711201 [Mycena metata]
MPAARAQRPSLAARNSKTGGTTREPPFRFGGERLAFLNQRLADFFRARARHDLRNFWQRVFEEYCTSMSYEDVDKKTAIIINTQMRIKGWFNHKHVRENLGLA